MRFLLPLFALLILGPLCLAPPLRAEEGQRTFPGGTCALKLPAEGEWSKAEIWAWTQICEGRWADMRKFSGDDQPCNPADITDTVPEGRRLSPRFLRLILTHPQYTAALERPQVEVDCARIEGELDLENDAVAPELALLQSHLTAGATFLRSHFARSLIVQGTQIDGKVSASSLEVGGDLFLRDHTTVKGELRLPGAKVGGNVSASGASFDGTVRADGIEVGGDLFLNDHTTVKGDLRLIGAKVGGDVAAIGASIKGKVRADGIEVGGELFLREGAVFKQGIALTGARVGGNVHFGASTFAGRIELSGARVAGDLILSSSDIGRPNWGAEASLILRNATAQGFQAEIEAFQRADGGWIDLDLAGFDYRTLGGLRAADRSSGRTNLADASAAQLIALIERRDAAGRPDPAHDAYFTPQPYRALARALTEAGALPQAEAVEEARFEHERRAGNTPLRDRIWLWGSKLFIGYGLHPFRVLYWFAGLVGLGVALAYRSRELRHRNLVIKLMFSVENALPLIEARASFQSVRHGDAWVEGLFHAQKVAGFVLATVLVGALTLLGG
ncbi:hypothetical protein C8J27_101863 [Rhodobacter aestuarii]|uniref:Polymer-forming protein n=1 Tax=Rhodobacter aestuarii TaxID=453582 RepID=A0A1N7PCT6_9RHOB|nr:hypothetical protein [Rhodobacter aestuarii]PTV97745.1 hypothetical protein C8J27_101863 [Rhodobacter aestuarii]SIT08433.1 hypothetical protein SAMN05421580_109223 [Rhodobacter aestuarii]